MNYKQLKVLHTELQKAEYVSSLAAKDYAGIAATLNAQAEIANPTPQPTRPKLIAWDTFMDLLSAGDVLVMYAQGNLAIDLRAALDANNRPLTLAIWRGLKTVLLAGSISAVQAEAAKTEPDPNWQATILEPSIAMGLGLPPVQWEDVQTVHHRMAGV